MASRDHYQLSSNASEVLGRLHRLPSAIQTGVVAGFERGLILAETAVRRGTEIRSRRGAGGLMGRLTSSVRAAGPMGIEGQIGFRRADGFPYELSQEFGARAKPGKAMAVPISPRARRASERGRGPRVEFGSELFMIRRADQTDMNRAGLLAERQGKTRIEVHYVLIRRLKPRLNFRKSIRSSLPTISREIERAARGAIQS